MNKRTLGRTGFEVSEIGLGGVFYASGGREEGVKIIRRALELGVNFFDTAPSYSNGFSQEILGEALDGVEQEHFVSTKIGPTPLFDDDRYDYDSVMQQFEFNLKALRRDRIDVLQMHDIDRFGSPRTEPGSYSAIFGKGMALEALQKLKEQGLIRAIGLATLWTDFQAYVINSGEIDAFLTFNRFGLIWRDAQFQTFPFARFKNVGVIQGTPLHQGVLSVPKPEWIEEPPEWMSPVEHDRYRRLLSIQKECGIPLAELALRFILSNRDVSVTIPGAANIEQLEANVACSTKGSLPVDLQAEIEALGILHEDPRRYV